MCPLRISGTIPNAVVFACALYEASAIFPRARCDEGKGAMPKDVIEKMTNPETHGLGASHGRHRLRI